MPEKYFSSRKRLPCNTEPVPILSATKPPRKVAPGAKVTVESAWPAASAAGAAASTRLACTSPRTSTLLPTATTVSRSELRSPEFDPSRHYLLAYELQRRFFVRAELGQIVKVREMAIRVQQADPKFAAGDAFNVVTFSIDAREAPSLAGPKRDYYLKAYDGRATTQPGWWFLTSTPGQGSDVPTLKKNIRQLTNSLGYPFLIRDQKFTKGPNGEELETATIITTNTYVGMLKAIPDSRTPRRLTSISTNTATTPTSTVCGSSVGYADVIAATPPEIDTETVRM